MGDMRSTKQPSLAGKLVSVKQLYTALENMQAERDEDGRFKVYASHAGALLPQFLLGVETADNDVLVTNSSFVMINGQPMSMTNVLTLAGIGHEGEYPVIY